MAWYMDVEEDVYIGLRLKISSTARARNQLD